MENPNYKNENIGRIYLNNMRESQLLKVRNSPSESQKDFIKFRIER